MKVLTLAAIKNILKEFEERSKNGESKDAITIHLKNNVQNYFEDKAILGFDIFRYSQYLTVEQSLIPHLFKTLYRDTIMNCLNHEPYFFQFTNNIDFGKHFIDAGDGGFQIFDSPFHAIIFAIYFQANVKRYNSGKSFGSTSLRKLIGEITLRYCITYDATYSYNKNFYGPSIINNARIMAKDKLNRFLIDENTFGWFTEYFNGIENLQAITFKDISNVSIFNTYKALADISKSTVLFEKNKPQILNVDILKIGEIRSKLDTLSIHNLHMQILLYSRNKGFQKFTISLGNLNSGGITE